MYKRQPFESKVYAEEGSSSIEGIIVGAIEGASLGSGSVPVGKVLQAVTYESVIPVYVSVVYKTPPTIDMATNNPRFPFSFIVALPKLYNFPSAVLKAYHTLPQA